MKVLIIGGVAAGTKTAAKIKREMGDNCSVTILNKGDDISYAGCGLPYYVGKIIEDKSSLIVNTPESFSKLTGAEVRCGVEVTSIDRNAKQVTLKTLSTGEKENLSYDKLVIATGADPIKPPIPGIDLPGVFFMRTPNDAIKLRDSIENGIKRAVVIGGGFIGLEIAENLSAMGIRVSVVDMAEHVMPGFDTDFAEYVENHMADKGIMIFTGDQVVGIEGENKVEKLRTKNRAIKTDLVVMSVGIRPNTGFLKDTGLEFAPNNTIIADEYMLTNDKDIYVVGDCAFVKNSLTNKPTWSPMGSSANHEGRICAQNISGKSKTYNGVLGTTVVKLPELNAGKTGLSKEIAEKEGYNVCSVTIATDDKAHYYPGASNFIIRMVTEKNTRKLLGVQVMGPGAVDKIVDIAATAITLGADLYSLESMDLAYAPPFSTAIHPFVVAVNVLQNKLNGELDSVLLDEIEDFDSWTKLDVSKAPSIPSLRYIPVGEINGEIEGLAKDEKILLICAKGKNSYMAQNRLRRFGYTNTKVLEGGILFYPNLKVMEE
ncbi:TPA: FAD-dependent oxidoreductase [Clostridioides difficile]|nr:FAD-dependent oxidoreductase [Clostridioides difficile]